MRYNAFFLLLFVLSSSCQKEVAGDDSVETEPSLLIPNHVTVNESIGGYYSALPAHQAKSLRRYPLLVFSHGGLQFGDGKSELSKVLNAGIPALLKEKLLPASFTVKGLNYSFIILIPQFSKVPTNEEVFSFIDFAKKKYPVDSTRIYLAGLSRGSVISCDAAAAYPQKVAALVTMAGVSDTGDVVAKGKNIASNNLPLWAFHNDNDKVINVNFSRHFIGYINSFYPSIRPRYTEFETYGIGIDHDAWTKASDPDYRENNLNIYEWMLQYHR